MRMIPVVLAGGVGERLWPLSTPAMPKPFVLRDPSSESSQTLFQATIMRVTDRTRFAPPVIVCQQRHLFLVREQLRAIDVHDAQILLEPAPRNTAAAIALAVVHLRAHHPRATPILVMPSDHAIADAPAWAKAIEAGIATAVHGHIVTFAIAPDGPKTTYGYIAYGAPLGDLPGSYAVNRFVEKPDSATAAAMLAQGNHGFNSGMFLMTLATAEAQFTKHAADIAGAVGTAYAAASVVDGAWLAEADLWAHCPAIAFDRAVIEKTDAAAVIPLTVGWSDMGAWEALYGVHTHDAAGNLVEGSATLHDVEGCIIHMPQGQHLTAMGLNNMLVVAQGDQLLVAERSHAQAHPPKPSEHITAHHPPVAAVPQWLPNATYRPWGHFVTIERGAGYQVKRLTIRPGEKISLQTHQSRSEHWVVVAGIATVTRGDTRFTLTPHQSTSIAVGERHRLANEQSVPLVVIEVQTGSYLGEDDITRFDG